MIHEVWRNLNDCYFSARAWKFRWFLGYLQDGRHGDEDTGRWINAGEKDGQNLQADGHESRRKTFARRVRRGRQKRPVYRGPPAVRTNFSVVIIERFQSPAYLLISKLTFHLLTISEYFIVFGQNEIFDCIHRIICWFCLPLPQLACLTCLSYLLSFALRCFVLLRQMELCFMEPLLTAMFCAVSYLFTQLSIKWSVYWLLLILLSLLLPAIMRCILIKVHWQWVEISDFLKLVLVIYFHSFWLCYMQDVSILRSLL